MTYFSWTVHKLKHGRIKQHHFGEIFGFNSALVRFPKDNACIILLSNLEGLLLDDIIDNLVDILFQEQ